MHVEILGQKQKKLLPWLKAFNKDFGLVGGTALALQVGHRSSIDFDLFSIKSFSNLDLQRKIFKTKKISRILVDHEGELTVIIEGVKVTFLYYPFPIKFSVNINKIIDLADILTIAALKAYALGRRAKFKDYVDLYFIIKNFYSLDEIIKATRKIFKENFNEKIFRTQLAYFEDIDYSEKVIYQAGSKVTEKEIRSFLIEESLR